MDFDSQSSALQKREFIAVILAGFGNELSPLTSDHGGEPCPKALLPIANKSMIEYPLKWIEQSGITDVLLLCPSSHRAALTHYIHSDTTSHPTLRIDLQAYDDTVHDLSTGTCAILRHFASRIQDDFVLLPCDFIPPPTLELSTLLNKFRTDALADGAIATTCWFTAPPKPEKAEKGGPPEEWGPAVLPTSIVWDQPTGTLLHIDSPDDQENNKDDFEIRMGLLAKYPHVRLSAAYQDSHVYVCRRSVLDVLEAKPHLESLREEFLPWLCKVQYQKVKKDKYGHVLNPATTNPHTQSTALRHSTTVDRASLMKPYAKPSARTRRSAFSPRSGLTPMSAMSSAMASPKIAPSDLPSARYSSSAGLPAPSSRLSVSTRIDEMSAEMKQMSTTELTAPPSPTMSDDEDRVLPPSMRVGIITHSCANGYTARANNFHTFLDVNRRALGETTYMLPTDQHDRALIDQKVQISADSMVGESTKIDERTSVKKSVIGKHCIIGKMAKISGCIILDHCVIGDLARLEGCILGKNSKVGEKAELVKCITQAGYEIQAGESFKNEKLDVSDWADGREEASDGDDDESEEDGTNSGDSDSS